MTASMAASLTVSFSLAAAMGAGLVMGRIRDPHFMSQLRQMGWLNFVSFTLALVGISCAKLFQPFSPRYSLALCELGVGFVTLFVVSRPSLKGALAKLNDRQQNLLSMFMGHAIGFFLGINVLLFHSSRGLEIRPFEIALMVAIVSTFPVVKDPTPSQESSHLP